MVPVICFFEPTAITDIYEPSLTMTNINQLSAWFAILNDENPS